MKRIAASILLLGMIAGCGDQAQPDPRSTLTPGASANPSLAEARRAFATRLGPQQPPGNPAPEPPPNVLRLVRYPSPVGDLSAYVTPDPGDGTKHPAIVWITGGDSNTIDELWEPAPRENDQTAAAYRQAGIVLMLPSLRGGNDNPGRREGFLGEVDDVLAAADYLAKQPYVDPDRIYLGGHSTGGTLVMLVAEMSDRFRAAFAFGPVDDVRSYGGEFLYHDDPNDAKEALVRSPGYWLDDVRRPLFVIEASGGNIESLKSMEQKCKNQAVRFVTVPGLDHFSVLAPANAAIAARILADTGPTSALTLSATELAGGAP